MREIKFRVWDKDMKYMHVCGENVHDSMMFIYNVACYYNLQNGCGSLPNGEGAYELMQYTGLKDRNGKEIYEGDVVEVIEMPCSPDEVNFTAKIIYRDGSFWMEEGSRPELPLHEITYEPYTSGYRPLVCKVIGNIFENPELISNV